MNIEDFLCIYTEEEEEGYYVTDSFLDQCYLELLRKMDRNSSQ